MKARFRITWHLVMHEFVEVYQHSITAINREAEEMEDNYWAHRDWASVN